MASKKQYWLMKSEPEECSIHDLEDRDEHWYGVRNFQARNFMQAMKVGDGVLFYHSSTKVPGVYGLAEIVSGTYPDATQFDPASPYYDPASRPDKLRWVSIDVRHVRTFAAPITLIAIRAIAAELGEGFALTRKANRLSVMPITTDQWKRILRLEPKQP